MPLIQGAEIEYLLDLFIERGVKLYHACQYKDFKSYLEIGGIPSRNLMGGSGLPYTTFNSDDIDKNNEVWDKVFVNLSDFGHWFARGNWNNGPVPNPYGPILLVSGPEVLYEATDIAICLRSAGGKNFNRTNESLSSVDDVNRLFHYSIEDAPNTYAMAYIKFSQDLRKEFNNPQAMQPEVSCTLSNEKLSFNHLEKIIVDPYIINGKNLLEEVRNLKRTYRLDGVLWERRYSENRQQIIQELADVLSQRSTSLDELRHNHDLSGGLRDWATRIANGPIPWQYERFAPYLREGTILELMNEAD